ncbi:tyrosine-type recombinase/integrase, partial [Candidatus Bipolaricaulota bacterium]|nr:tyrosine-type recombinase/integrase [Candidatus Bipolaricaulota bacterium]
DDGLKKTSVAIHYRVLRAFFNWLERDGHISSSPVNGIKEPKTPDKFPKVLNKDQVEKMLNTARNWRRTWAGYRNFTMITLFLDTGLRLNECLSAELDDLDMEQRSIKVNGKGAKDRRVYFGKNASRCLVHWLNMRDGAERITDDTIFISESGEKLKRRHVQHVNLRC